MVVMIVAVAMALAISVLMRIGAAFPTAFPAALFALAGFCAEELPAPAAPQGILGTLVGTLGAVPHAVFVGLDEIF
jgi:hypothetical protein